MQATLRRLVVVGRVLHTGGEACVELGLDDNELGRLGLKRESRRPGLTNGEVAEDAVGVQNGLRLVDHRGSAGERPKEARSSENQRTPGTAARADSDRRPGVQTSPGRCAATSLH